VGALVIVEASARLIAAARELDETSKALVQTENAIEMVEPEYEDAIEATSPGSGRSASSRRKKFPPQDVRNALAVKAMPDDLRSTPRPAPAPAEGQATADRSEGTGRRAALDRERRQDRSRSI
jgi:hypothetical protein